MLATNLKFTFVNFDNCIHCVTSSSRTLPPTQTIPSCSVGPHCLRNNRCPGIFSSQTIFAQSVSSHRVYSSTEPYSIMLLSVGFIPHRAVVHGGPKSHTAWLLYHSGVTHTHMHRTHLLKAEQVCERKLEGEVGCTWSTGGTFSLIWV